MFLKVDTVFYFFLRYDFSYKFTRIKPDSVKKSWLSLSITLTTMYTEFHVILPLVSYISNDFILNLLNS
jgi:hypothetical protein